MERCNSRRKAIPKLTKCMVVSAKVLTVIGFSCLACVLFVQAREQTNAAGNQVPDLSGVWMEQSTGGTFSKDPAPPMTPWAETKFRANLPTMGPRAALDANDPTLNCFPPGLPYILIIPTPVEIIQTPGRLTELFEYDHSVRRIYTDGRKHPGDLKETGVDQWMGHSIGRWAGDTLVVDTIGFNDKTWLDRLGHPHSDALHVVERIRRVDHDTLEDRITVADPVAYTRPWKGLVLFKLKSNWDIFEHICVTQAEEGRDYFQYHERTWSPPK